LAVQNPSEERQGLRRVVIGEVAVLVRKINGAAPGFQGACGTPVLGVKVHGALPPTLIGQPAERFGVRLGDELAGDDRFPAPFATSALMGSPRSRKSTHRPR